MQFGLMKLRNRKGFPARRVIIVLCVALIVAVSIRYLYVTFPSPWKEKEVASRQEHYAARLKCYSRKSFFGSPRRWTHFSIIRHSGLGDYEVFACVLQHPKARTDWTIQWSEDDRTVIFRSDSAVLTFDVPTFTS